MSVSYSRSTFIVHQKTTSFFTQEIAKIDTYDRRGNYSKVKKHLHVKIDNQLGSLDDVAGMSDKEVDEMEDTVCVDTITFCALT